MRARHASDARRAAWQALVALEKGRVRRLREALDAAALSDRDLSFAWELALGCERHRRLLDFALEPLTERGLPRDPHLLCALRLGAYQLLFLTRVPPRAAVHETVGLLRRGAGFCNAVLRALAASRATVATLDLPPGDRGLAIRHSLPDELVARWRRFFPRDVERLCAASSSIPAVHLRVNRLRGGAGRLQELLRREGVDCEAGEHEDLLRWTGGGSPFRSRCFAEGWFVAQDPTALAAVDAVQARAGETVVDLCAAPGTKATRLAEQVRPGGRVLALDPDRRRRPRIVENAERLGLSPWLRVVETAPAGADRVVADVPCSNTGVLARRVEVRRRWSAAALAELTAIQAGILRQALDLVRPGGTVVYSTCSLEPEENGELVRSHLLPGFELVAERSILPEPRRCDGGYFAVLRRGIAAGLPADSEAG